MSSDGGPNTLRNPRLEDPREWTKREYDVRLHFDDLPRPERPIDRSKDDIVDSKSSGRINSARSRERGSKSIIDALLRDES